MNRDFTAEGTDQLGVADTTQVPTWADWLYLAVALEVCSRRIAGWAMAPHMRAKLVEDALAMAALRRQPRGGLVHQLVFSKSGGSGAAG